MTRIRMLNEEELTPAQAAACAEAIQGRRGKVPVPMIAWLRNPELASRIQKLGELLRFETSLNPAMVEMAILICARHWTAHVEWKVHKELALKAGLDPRVVESIAAHREPVLNDETARVIYELASNLLKKGRVPDELYATAVAKLGERGVAELISILGYYTLVSFTLNTFELGLPERAAIELHDLDFPGQ